MYSEGMPANGGEPINITLRRRREELGLKQEHLAEHLHVTPQTVGQWERGLRRMELGKIPRIAALLELDAKELCARALAEFYPSVYAALFNNRPDECNPTRPERFYAVRRSRSAASRNRSKSLAAARESS